MRGPEQRKQSRDKHVAQVPLHTHANTLSLMVPHDAVRIVISMHVQLIKRSVGGTWCD